jgi:hypothetical protein
MGTAKHDTPIAVAVITAAATLVAAYWQFVWKPKNDSIEQNLEYVGRIVDESGKDAVASAKVSLELPNARPIAYTDSEGVFKFTMPMTPKSVINAKVRVEASGYRQYDRLIVLTTTHTTLQEIHLQPTAPATRSLPLRSHPRNPEPTLSQDVQLALANAQKFANTHYEDFRQACREYTVAYERLTKYQRDRLDTDELNSARTACDAGDFRLATALFTEGFRPLMAGH